MSNTFKPLKQRTNEKQYRILCCPYIIFFVKCDFRIFRSFSDFVILTISKTGIKGQQKIRFSFLEFAREGYKLTTKGLPVATPPLHPPLPHPQPRPSRISMDMSKHFSPPFADAPRPQVLSLLLPYTFALPLVPTPPAPTPTTCSSQCFTAFSRASLATIC
jgi:hypothetical protein